MNRLYFTEEAELDLTQIIEFTNKQWGVDQARQYLEKIHQTLHLLTPESVTSMRITGRKILV